MGIPQWIIVAISILTLCDAAYEHGRPRKPRNFWVALVGNMLLMATLYWGGFFTK